jgi:hypothetical protein
MRQSMPIWCRLSAAESPAMPPPTMIACIPGYPPLATDRSTPRRPSPVLLSANELGVLGERQQSSIGRHHAAFNPAAFARGGHFSRAGADAGS